MKTFEDSHIRESPSQGEDARVVLLMYFLRAASLILILALFLYIVGKQLAFLDAELKFPEFVSANILALSSASLFLFLLQALFYAYLVRRKTAVKRSRGEIIIGYALPILGIIAAVYAAYAIGAM
ncbi:hypothetical protein H0N99_02530 [Candidatus Micrarchaeota archaeon]|nr:hypothetical protein [Candidatus Micrarchaeota archaeon]